MTDNIPPTIWSRTDTPALQAQLAHLLEKRTSLDITIADLQQRLCGQIVRNHIGTANLQAHHIRMDAWRRSVMPVITRGKAYGRTYQQIAEKLKDDRVPTIRKGGSDWTREAVAKMWHRHGKTD